ncbi:hypothetical protein HELRODRAFT_176933 [Helobdella robusta]|uniref:Uncharacterized protein n=1 Tax=Helobdella robusta TaxID=6412 RepID=T1FB21_HELRO|nr:hypothetical protein HELRODRAFT_176933 [Helobdella robusta]ESN98458.1 hypothetical protein HELRODRAFT_176933 [Helobdella robusta]
MYKSEHKSSKSPERRSHRDQYGDDYNKSSSSGYKWGGKDYEEDRFGSSNKDAKSYSPYKKKYVEQDYKTKKYDDYHKESSSKFDRKKDSSEESDDKRDTMIRSRKSDSRLPRSYRSRSPVKSYSSKDISDDYKSKDSDYRTKESDYRSKESDYRSKESYYRNKDLSRQLYKSEYLAKDDAYHQRKDARPYVSNEFIRRFPPPPPLPHCGTTIRKYSPKRYDLGKDRVRPFYKSKYPPPPPHLPAVVPPPAGRRRSNYSPSYIKAITSKPESLFKSLSPKLKPRPYLGNSRFFNIKYRYKPPDNKSTSAENKTSNEDKQPEGDGTHNEDDNYKNNAEDGGDSEDKMKKRDNDDDATANQQQLGNKKRYLVDRLAEYERNRKHKLSDDDDDDDHNKSNDGICPSSKKIKMTQSRGSSTDEYVEHDDEGHRNDDEAIAVAAEQQNRNEMMESEHDERRNEQDVSRSPSPLSDDSNYKINFPSTSSQAQRGRSSSQLKSIITSSSSRRNKLADVDNKKGDDDRAEDDNDDIYPPLKHSEYVRIPYNDDNKYVFKPLYKLSSFKKFPFLYNNDGEADGGALLGAHKGVKKFRLTEADREMLKFTVIISSSNSNGGDCSESHKSSGSQVPMEQGHKSLDECDLRHKIHDRRTKRQTTSSSSALAAVAGSADSSSKATNVSESTSVLETLDVHNIDMKQPIRRVVESKDSHSLVTTISNGPMVESKRSVVITRQQSMK